FRPGRSAHDAVEAARRYVEEGYGWVVDLDIEKFFDRVDHDVLTARVARRVRDKRVLRLIRRYLQAGVMVEGVAVRTDEGTPQGGPLGPPFANVLLDELDKEPERRVEDIEGWLHRRLRACVGKQWKRPHTRYRELRALGLPAWAARQYAGSRRGFWRMAGGPLNQALPRSYWQRQGLLDLVDSYRRLRYA
ncbi:MAG: reverse transcriptase domain-containing protein, partial [Acidobacteriota bacterium]